MNAGNFLPLVGSRKRESELADPLGLHLGNDLERFNDTRNGLVLQARVFTFSILTDNAHVNIRVTGDVSRHVLNQNNGGIDV